MTSSREGEGVDTFVTLCMKAYVKQEIQCDRGGEAKGVAKSPIYVTSLMDDPYCVCERKRQRVNQNSCNNSPSNQTTWYKSPSNQNRCNNATATTKRHLLVLPIIPHLKQFQPRGSCFETKNCIIGITRSCFVCPTMCSTKSQERSSPLQLFHNPTDRPID